MTIILYIALGIILFYTVVIFIPLLLLKLLAAFMREFKKNPDKRTRNL